MKGNIKLLACVLFIFVSCKRYDHPVIVLQDGWKYMPGDSSVWAAPAFEDASWQTVRVGMGVPPKELKGHPGYAWYRASVVIPSTLKAHAFFPDSLKILLGSIDDCDQVFLNGSLVGQNNHTVFSAPPPGPFQNAVGLWSTDRTYVLPVSDKRIHWDQRNVIAIRVFNQYGDGGMYKGIPALRTIGFEDMLVFDKKDLYKLRDNYRVDKDLLVKNISAHQLLRGSVVIQATIAGSTTNIYHSATDLRLGPGDSQTIVVQLPVSTDPVKLVFNYIDATTHQQVTDTDSLPYVLVKPE